MTFDMEAAQICLATYGADTRIALRYALDEIEQLHDREKQLVELALEKRIAELEALNDDLMKNGNGLRARAQKAEARIGELEGWLVEERATYMHHLMYGDGAFYLASWTDRARDQLHREGKI